MSKRNRQYSGSAFLSDQTFRFDSKALFKNSVRKSSTSPPHPNQINLDLSQNTSEVARFAGFSNQNILELLQQSEEEKRTQKGEKIFRNDVWNFFARFEKQSNPDITISQIDIIQTKPQIENKDIKVQNDLKRRVHKKAEIQKQKKTSNKNQEFYQYGDLQFMGNTIDEIRKREEAEGRYPRRNRVAPVRYWLGQKYVYRRGRIVGVIIPSHCSNSK